MGCRAGFLRANSFSRETAIKIMKREELNYAQRVSDYLDRMTHALRELKPWQREEFEQWSVLPTSKRDSDWPGWVKYTNLRARPAPFVLVVLERRPA